MAGNTPPRESGTHQVITANRTMRNIGGMGSCKNYVILLHRKSSRTRNWGIVVHPMNKRCSYRLTIECQLNRHVFTRNGHKYGPREDVNAINRSDECSGMSVVSVSDICNRVVVYDGVVSTRVALGCRHVCIECYHALGRCRDDSNFCKQSL